MLKEILKKSFNLLNLIVLVTILIYPLVLSVAVLYKIYEIIFKSGNYKNISGEIAVVTGAARGLGKEISIELAKQGCHIAIVDVLFEEAEKTAKLIHEEYNVKTKAYKVDVTNYEQVLELKENVCKDLGTATILVNNAGILAFSNPANPDYTEIQRMINVNLTAHFWTNRAFLPQMKKLNKGHIVAISSASSFFPLAHYTEYTSTKFAVRGLMRSLRLELHSDNYVNIHTTTAYPYFLQTNQDIVDFFAKSSLDRILPFITGQEVAQSIIKGILQNEKEILHPSSFEIFYKLLEFLPLAVQDLVAKPIMKILTNNLKEIKSKC